MKCENIRELMSMYIDDEINEVDKAKFEKHIAQCPQCKEEYELLKNVVLECSEIDEVELPESFREELHNKLMEVKTTKPNKLTSLIRRNKWTTAAGAAAAVLIIAVSLNFMGSQKSMEYAQTAPAEPSRSNASYDMLMDSSQNKGMGVASAPEAAPAPAAIAPEFSEEVQPNITFSKSMPGAGTDNQTQVATAEAEEQARKIIKNGNVSLKVAELQARIQEITALAGQGGGYVESSYVDSGVQPIMYVEDGIKKERNTQNASMTIKVPAERFESTFQSIKAMGELLNESTTSSDITSQYRDLEARVENLKVQEKNLQEIMTKATNVEDILKIEVELNRVRTEIDLMTGNLKNWDRLVEYSTIYISMTEVKETELEKVDVPGVWQNAQQGFINALNNIKNGIERLFVFLVSALPYVVILGAGSLFAVLWIKRKKNS